jgi:hypothetical protein
VDEAANLCQDLGAPVALGFGFARRHITNSGDRMILNWFYGHASDLTEIEFATTAYQAQIDIALIDASGLNVRQMSKNPDERTSPIFGSATPLPHI